MCRRKISYGETSQDEINRQRRVRDELIIHAHETDVSTTSVSLT